MRQIHYYNYGTNHFVNKLNNLLVLKDLKLVAMHVKSLHVSIVSNEAITCIKTKYDNHSIIFRPSTSLPYSKFHLKNNDGTTEKIRAPAYAAYSNLNLRYSSYNLLCVTN